MRLGYLLILLAAAPAPGGRHAPRHTPKPAAAAGPKVLGPDAPPIAYSSVPFAGLVPMSQADVLRVLRNKRSYPEHSRVPVWHQRNGASRLVSFGARGQAVDTNCEPTPCTGKYSVSGNVVTIDFKPRAGVMRLTFYTGAGGLAMVYDDWGPKDGRVSPY